MVRLQNQQNSEARYACIQANTEALTRIETKLDMLSQQVTAHIAEDTAFFASLRESLDGNDSYPGVRGRIFHLEQRLSDGDLANFKTFRTQIKTVVGALIMVVSFLGWDWIRNAIAVTVINGSPK